MQLAFTLSMPSRNSWNGKWSGEDKLYVIVKTFTGTKEIAKAVEVAAKHSYSYRWSDGWAARIDVKVLQPGDAKRLRAKSQGFCGYDWMVTSILSHGAIYAAHEVPEKQRAVQ